MVNHVKASCGHYVPAVGFDGSSARKKVEQNPCFDCCKRPLTIDILIKGKMVNNQPAVNPERACFVICCDHGDWSGFRTLAECQKQYPELEAKGRSDGYFWVEER